MDKNVVGKKKFAPRLATPVVKRLSLPTTRLCRRIREMSLFCSSFDRNVAQHKIAHFFFTAQKGNDLFTLYSGYYDDQ